MSAPFDLFVVCAEMRTGSNFLETNLNAFPGISCHGEAFNPHFIGYPNKSELMGVSKEARDADPLHLVGLIRRAPGGIAGFRYFHDHDPRVLDALLDDVRCAKIILIRNPLDSYVSWKIAQTTGQWKLTDVKRRKEAQAKFDEQEFADHLQTQQDFQLKLLNRLQVTGQTPFYIAYEDLQDVDVMNGLARWLGVPEKLEALDKSLKPQNPGPVTDKVSNPGQMAEAMARLDRFNLSRTPNFEPRRGPAVPSYVAADNVPLLYLPLRGGPDASVLSWMAALDGVPPGSLTSKMSQKELRQWKRRHPGHRSFTVLRHPLARAHSVFCSKILSTGPGSYAQIRETLRRQFKLPLPKSAPGEAYDRATHRAAFAGFLSFVQANLAGQTAVRVDAGWSTQSQALQGFGELALPDFVLREEELPTLLPVIAEAAGHYDAPPPPAVAPDGPFSLADIYDADLEEMAARIYQRDYMMFGFSQWTPGADQAA